MRARCACLAFHPRPHIPDIPSPPTFHRIPRSVGRHLLPHYAAVRRLIVHGLERNSQVHSPAWARPLHHLLESVTFAFPALASCLWKDCATGIVSHVLAILSSPLPARSTITTAHAQPHTHDRTRTIAHARRHRG